LTLRFDDIVIVILQGESIDDMKVDKLQGILEP